MKFNITIIIIAAIGFISGCKSKSEDPSPQDQQKVLLINDGIAWKLGTVTKDGLDVTDQFDGFRLTIGDFTYTTVNALSSAWPSEGSWSFANNEGTIVNRSDGVVITVQVSTTSLKLTFNVTGLGSGGRVKGVDGEYTFDLVPA